MFGFNAPPRASRLALLLGCLASLDAGAARAKAREPVVVELFTSQGCSACNAANALAEDLGRRPGVLALTFPVDYWDYLGWRDTYAQPAFSERQRSYMKALGRREVYTPQVVVDGQADADGSATERALADKVDDLVRLAAKAEGAGPTLRLRRHALSIGAGRAPRGGAEVWLVRYQDAPAGVVVKDGENRGQTVRYHDVVRELTPLGAWTGPARRYPLPAAGEGGLKTVILLQAKRDGRILGVLTP